MCLKRITEHFPTPVIIVSTIAKEGSQVRADAKAAGAVGVLDKDKLELYKGQVVLKNYLLPELRAALIRGPGKFT